MYTDLKAIIYTTDATEKFKGCCYTSHYDYQTRSSQVAFLGVFCAIQVI